MSTLHNKNKSQEQRLTDVSMEVARPGRHLLSFPVLQGHEMVPMQPLRGAWRAALQTTRGAGFFPRNNCTNPQSDPAGFARAALPRGQLQSRTASLLMRNPHRNTAYIDGGESFAWIQPGGRRRQQDFFRNPQREEPPRVESISQTLS